MATSPEDLQRCRHELRMVQQQLRRRVETRVPSGTERIAFQLLLAAEGTSDTAQLFLSEQSSLDEARRRQCLQCLVTKYKAMTPEQRRKAAETAGTETQARRADG